MSRSPWAVRELGAAEPKIRGYAAGPSGAGGPQGDSPVAQADGDRCVLVADQARLQPGASGSLSPGSSSTGSSAATQS